MSSINNNPNLSALDKLGVPVKPFEIVTNAISLADLVYKVGRILFDEKVQIIQPKDGRNIQLNVGEAGNLFLKINFQGPMIDAKKFFYPVKFKDTTRKSGVIVELVGQKVYPPEKDEKGNALDPSTFLVDTKHGRYETQPTRIPIIAAGRSILVDSSIPYELKILAFNKRIKTGKKSNWEHEEDSDAAIVRLWFQNPFSLQSFTINEKEDEKFPHTKAVEKVIMKLRFGYEKGNSNDVTTSGLKTCHCDFSISCSPHVTNPSVEVEPRHSADIGATSVKGSSITVNARNLALENSKFFVFVIGYRHRGITDKPIEGIKEFSIQKAQVNGITEAKGQRGDIEYPVKRKWTIPIQFPSCCVD